MLIVLGADRMKGLIAEAVEQAGREAEEGARKRLVLLNSVTDLKKQIADLEIQRDKKQEEFARREREVEHKVGLERKRQEFEIAAAKRETGLAVREENLSADKDRFKTEMDFQRQLLESEVKSLRELVAEMLKRLPSAEIITTIGAPSPKKE